MTSYYVDNIGSGDELFSDGTNVYRTWASSYNIDLTTIAQEIQYLSPKHVWTKLWLVASSVPSHYLNQCWLIANWALRNKLLWNSNHNTRRSIHENAFSWCHLRPFCPGEEELTGWSTNGIRCKHPCMLLVHDWCWLVIHMDCTWELVGFESLTARLFV